jgi:recombination protein RecA
MAQSMDSRAPASVLPHSQPELTPVAPLPSTEVARPEWSLATVRGRLCELVSHGQTPLLSAAMRLVHQAQQEAQPVAWIAAGTAPFYPPDMAESGVDLSALPTVRAVDLKAGLSVADTLLRSGAFGLVVFDFGSNGPVPLPVQTRLLGLVRKHDCGLLFLSRAESKQREQGTLVSLRGEGHLEPDDRADRAQQVRLHLHFARDKRFGPGWHHEEIFRGPHGMC